MRYLLVFFILFVYAGAALAFEPGPALTDREIIESLVELKAGQAGFDKRFDDMDNRIDDMGNRIGQLSNLVLWGFGVMFIGIFALIGFVLWDRRTELAPAVKRNEAMSNALIEYS